MKINVISVISVLLFLMFYSEADAQPQITIVSSYREQTITIGTEPREIILMAKSPDQSVTFAWNLKGGGELQGDWSLPGVLYAPPSNIGQTSQRVTITVTVTDQAGQKASESVSYILKKPEPTPTPKPTSTPVLEPTATSTPDEEACPRPRNEPQPGTLRIEEKTGMEFVWIPTGEFLMGCGKGETECDSDEKPQHKVCVDGSWMGKYEVTNAQYRRWKGEHDSKDYNDHSLNGDSQPAVYVSWDDAKAFAEWLGDFRLPTEAEWEYAVRAGTTTSRFWGNNPDDACQYANVHDLTSKRINKFGWTHHECDDGHTVTAPVGSFSPNNFGLYDMLGNVWEWCEDIYDDDAYESHSRQNPLVSSGGSYRVLRGGSWFSEPRRVRSANRYGFPPSYWNSYIGFRLLRNK